jgi:hypothetical protein
MISLRCTTSNGTCSYNGFIRRRYFRTHDHYLGLSVQTIQPGDGVYLIAGAADVFRPVSEDPKDGFRLIGEALAKGPVKFETMEIH